MAIHQISVFLENRAGQLAEITALLFQNNIDLRAINIAETSDYGVLRLIADDEEKACRVLNENGFICSVSEVFVIGVPDRPGELSVILGYLAEAQIDIAYMYSVFGQQNGVAYMIFRVEDGEKFKAAMAAHHIALADTESFCLQNAE